MYLRLGEGAYCGHMHVKGIHHVSINVENLAEAMAFYVDKLGFEALPRPDFSFPGAWLATGGQQVHLLELPGEARNKTQHWAFEVDDLDLALAELDAAGVPYRKAEGRTQAFLKDPSGNMIEVQQPMPAA